MTFWISFVFAKPSISQFALQRDRATPKGLHSKPFCGYYTIITKYQQGIVFIYDKIKTSLNIRLVLEETNGLDTLIVRQSSRKASGFVGKMSGSR